MSKFTHLHVHTQYSLLDGLPKIPELLDYAKTLGMDTLAITDHGVVYGAVEFFKEATKRGIKPIIGCEIYVANNRMFDKRPNIDDKRYHLILLVKNETGYKNLVKLVTKAHLEGFYYKPRVDKELLSQHAEGLIALSACLQGEVTRLAAMKKTKEAESTALKYQEIFGKGNFYLELQYHQNIKEQKIANDALIEISKKTGIPLVATQDIHYLKPEDAQAQDVLMLINTGADPNDPERLTMKLDDFSMTSPEKMAEIFKDVPEALENTQKIADLCDFKFELGKWKLPKFETPGNEPPDEYLKALCLQGLEKKFGPKPSAEVLQRLNFELETIKKVGYASYFLIVQDFANWARDNRIVFSARGTANSSLVGYLLNITRVDPIKYNLYFERFLNPERISPADIDIDFTDRRRDEVINYVSQKYGKDKVAQIITFGTMAARAVIRDVGRALGYSYTYCDQMAKMIPFGFTLDDALKQIKEFKDLYEQDTEATKLVDIAKKLEGVARHASTHACGVVISADPLDNLTPLQHPTQDDQNIVTQYEMHSIEDLGLLKMDFLGLKNLTIIEDTLARIYVIHNKSIDIENIPLDDKDVYKILREGKTAGIFQLEGQGMTRYLVDLKPTEFEDIIAMIALFRPGPMEYIPSFIKRKHGKEKIEYLHPKLKPILEKTQGICIFQEQLMQIARNLAGFTMGEADVLRKAVGKKIRTLLNEQEDKLVKGMVKNEIPEKTAKKIWEWILPFARYGFARAHAAGYAIIAYQTAWLKTHYPVEFMASLLTSEKHDVEKIAFLIEECKKMKIEVLPPDINESLTNFTVVPKENKIRFGLSGIKNVGTNIVKAITDDKKANGPFKNLGDFLARIQTRDLNKKSMEALAKAGVFDSLTERNQILENMEEILEFNRSHQKNKSNGQRSLFAGVVNFKAEIRLASVAPATTREKLDWEKELLGLFVTSHPLDGMKNALERQKASPLEKITKEIEGKRVKVAGIISSLKKIVTKTGKPMLFVNLEDLTDKKEVIVFPSILERNPLPFRENKVVFIEGRVSCKDDMPKIICDQAEEILET